MGRAGAGSADGRECSNRWALRADAATPHARSCGGPASPLPFRAAAGNTDGRILQSWVFLVAGLDGPQESPRPRVRAR